MSDIECHHPDFTNVMTFEYYVWAWSVVNTRCVYMKQPLSPHVSQDEEDHFALAPYLDLLNHSSKAQVLGTKSFEGPSEFTHVCVNFDFDKSRLTGLCG